jgi:hypothetical protein
MVSLLACGSSTATTSTPESMSVAMKAREPVELGDQQLGLVSLASSQRLHQLRALIAACRLDLRKLANQRPRPAVQVIEYGLALCLEAKGFTLASSNC